MKNLNTKVVVLTGATGGLGKEMVAAFLKEGSTLILSDITESSLKELITKFRGYGTGRILGYITLDLTTKEGIEDLVRYTLGYIESGPDVLVNNAGLAFFGPFQEIPTRKWEKIIELNLLAAMRLTHAFLPYMIKKQSGHIVNISSVAGIVATPGLTVYSTSKFGIRAFGEALSRELKPKGIEVTNVYPFFTRTPILESEQFGVKERKTLPDFVLAEPKDVVNDMILGIKNGTLHVFPGPIPMLFDWISRLLPGALNDLADRYFNS